MTLREEAEKAARETFVRVCEELNDSSEPISPREQRYINAYADAIERVARAFAERVAYEVTPGVFASSAPFTSHESRHKAILNAIAAAERGE